MAAHRKVVNWKALVDAEPTFEGVRSLFVKMKISEVEERLYALRKMLTLVQTREQALAVMGRANFMKEPELEIEAFKMFLTPIDVPSESDKVVQGYARRGGMFKTLIYEHDVRGITKKIADAETWVQVKPFLKCSIDPSLAELATQKMFELLAKASFAEALKAHEFDKLLDKFRQVARGRLLELMPIISFDDLILLHDTTHSPQLKQAVIYEIGQRKLDLSITQLTYFAGLTLCGDFKKPTVARITELLESASILEALYVLKGFYKRMPRAVARARIVKLLPSATLSELTEVRRDVRSFDRKLELAADMAMQNLKYQAKAE